MIIIVHLVAKIPKYIMNDMFMDNLLYTWIKKCLEKKLYFCGGGGI